MSTSSDLFQDTNLQQQAVTPKLDTAQSLYNHTQSQAEDRLKFIADETVNETPERANRSIEIMNRTGIPKKFIDENFDELDKAAKQSEFNAREFIHSSPKVADWMLKNPDYATLIKEDREAMAAMEKIITTEAKYRKFGEWKTSRGPAPSIKSVLSGIGTSFMEVLPKAIAGARLQFADVIGSEQMFTQASRDYEQSVGRELRAKPEIENTLGRWVYGGAENVVRMVPSIAAAVITKNPSVGLAVIGAEMQPQTYAKYRTRGGTAGEAFLGSAAETTVEIAMEKIPMGFIVDNLGKVGMGSFLRGFLGRELPTELIAEISQGAIDTAIANPDKTWNDFVAELPDTIGQTVTATLMMAGGLTLTNEALKRAAGKEQGPMTEDFFKALGDNSTNSKLRERRPDSYQQIVRDITKDGPVENVYTPVEFFQSHFQDQNIDPRKLATELGIERQYDEAINTGGKIAIPLDVYAKNLAPTEHNAVFAKEMSFGPDQMSSRETDEFLKEAEKEKEPETDAFGESLEQAMTPIREQLKAIYPADVADKNAAVIEARLRSRATRLGIDPQELMKQRPMDIVEGGTETGSVLNQLAYHGSPYQFKRFDMSKIGTGEGAQAYGFGLYFAESPEVAKSYSRMNSGANQKMINREGQIVDFGDSGDLFSGASTDTVTKKAGRYLSIHGDDAENIAIASYAPVSVIDEIKNLRNQGFQKMENFYKVDISDAAIKNFLDWDKPLSEQPGIVKKLKNLPSNGKQFNMIHEQLQQFELNSSTGQSILGSLDTYYGGDREKVSGLLNRLGIQGIRYLDQGSRKEGEGTSNFVVFDDSIIKILDVNGKPVPQEEQDKIVGAMHKEQDGGNELMQAQKQTDKAIVNWSDLDTRYSKALEGNRRERQRIVNEAYGVVPVDSDIERDGAHDPSNASSGAPAWDLSGNGIYPEDVYGPDGYIYYSTGDERLDRQAYSVVMGLEGTPNASVKIYRAVEENGQSKILPGDWVTTVRAYAKDHGEGALNGKYKIISKTVTAKDIYTSGDSWLEWGYNPQPNVYPRSMKMKDGRALLPSERLSSDTKNLGTFDPNDPNILKQEGQDIKRGSISVSPTGDVIRLFKAKNLSTLLHELSHRWLFEMQDDAALPNAPQQIKDDLAATLKYLGVDSVEELDITKIPKGTAAYAKAVAANEKFAETGEAYLMEGKAPSAALRRVFAQIRAWLVAVYKALKQGRLNGDLTPEMRGVFDRLLATDEEIAQAKAEANAIPLFTTAADVGYSDTEFSAYRKTIEDANREEREELDAKVMNEYKKTLTDIWKEEKAKVQVEVEAELDTDPIYLAMAKMKENGIKIARSEAGALPKSFTAKDGIPADMAAEMLGFTSGEAMVKALASTEARGARAARETNNRMDQRFGNLLTDGTLVEEARKAVMGDARVRIIEAEIKALNKKAREVKPFVKAKEKAEIEQARAGRDLYKALVPKLADVRDHAATVIAGKPIREIKPMQYYNAARQASREAINDVRKKDYLMAGYNKGRELLNLELYREAVKAQDMIEDGNQKLQKVFVADIKQSKSRNIDMVNAARAILASHGLGKTDSAPSTYLDKMRQYDPEIYENLRPIFEPAIASMKPYKDMTVEEYIGMRDAVFALMKTSRRSKQIEIDGKLIERDEAVANLVNRMMDLDKGKSKELRSTLDDMQKTKIGLLSAKAALRRAESWVSAMDGGADGPFRKFIWNPVSDAVNLYRDKKREVVAHYLDIVQQVAPTIKPGDIEAPELGFKFRGKNELLHALLHTGNDSNKAKLLIGYGWGERNEEGVLNTAKWDSFENRMRDEGKLTKADYNFAQNVWDMMEGMKPNLQEAHHRMYGYYFNEVTAKEFSNEFGTYRGGYVPAKVDVNVVQEAEQRKDAEEIAQGQNSFAFPTSGKGATMSRVEGYARPLQLDMRTIPAHIDWAMRFAYLEPAVKDVARVVLDKDFAKSMNGLDPTTINHMLVPWLQRTAQQLTSTRGMNKWVDKFWTGVRSRSGMQVMVLNVINTLQQFTGLTIAFTRVKPSNIRSSFWMYMTKNKEFSEEINEKSSFMRNRVFTAHNEVMQTIDDLLLNPSKYEKAKDFATKHGYFMQQATQGFVDQVVWHAAYNESLANGQSDKDSVRHADSTVRETQGSFAPEDLSRFEAGTPFVRAFSMFFNFFNMQANLLGTEAANIASNELGLRKGAGRALYVYTFAFMIPAYIGGAIIRALVAGGLDEDDDDEYMDDLIRLFFSSQFEAATAMVPVAGPLLNTAVNQWNKKWYDDKITVSPAVTAAESAVRAPYSVYKAIVDDGNEKRAVKDTLSLIGMATGLPAGALGRPLGYLADVHQGKANPENALDVTRGLISGQDVNR